MPTFDGIVAGAAALAYAVTGYHATWIVWNRDGILAVIVAVVFGGQSFRALINFLTWALS